MEENSLYLGEITNVCISAHVFMVSNINFLGGGGLRCS